MFASKKLMKRILSLFAVVLIAQPLLAYKYVGDPVPGANDDSNNNSTEVLPQLRSAACAPATALRDIERGGGKTLSLL